MLSRRKAASTASSGTFASRLDAPYESLPDVDPMRFEPLVCIGKGCFGKIVLAKIDTDFYAVKVAKKDQLQTAGDYAQAVNEAKIMKSACQRHPFLCASRGAFQTDDAYFLVTSFAAGGDLYFHVQEEGPLCEGMTKLLLMEVILGLQALHLRGIVHRDLKPENILITRDGHAQLTDFGLSKYLPKLEAGDEWEGRNSFSSFSSDFRSEINSPPSGCFSLFGHRRRGPTSADVVWGTTRTRCGTPTYRCPDAVLGHEYGLEADFWALGCITYECLTGHPPFSGKTIKELNQNIVTATPKYRNLNPLLSPRARMFIQELLIKDRTKRLGSGARGMKDLKAHFFFTDKSRPKFYFTWEQVASLSVPPIYDVKEKCAKNPVACVASDFKKMEVIEMVTPSTPKVIEGYQPTSNDVFLNKFIVESVPKPLVINHTTSRSSLRKGKA